jgi:Kef-type K+ transport system membrane component KefB
MVTDGLSPFTVLAFLGGVLAVVVLAVAYVLARITGRQPLAKAALMVGAVGAGAYVLVFAIASVSSRDRVLAPGEEKHICEIDCHLAYSVAAVKTEPVPSGGTRYTVSVKVRFDEETISNRRPRDMPLSPNSRYVALVDAAGDAYPGSTEGLKRRLIPGESYTTDIAFDVPAGAADLRLVLRNADFETSFIIGHENSIGHAKTTFALARNP